MASLLRARDKPSQGFASYTRSLAEVTADGEYSVIIKTNAPDPLLLNSLSRLRIISADYVDADPSSFDRGEAMVGTGPFKFASYTPGSGLELSRNDDYFRDPAAWSAVSLRFLPDDGARLAALLAGEVDLIETIPAEGLDRVENTAGLRILRGQSTRIVYLGLDQHRDESPFITAKDGSSLGTNPLKDPRVRRALLTSINREAIVERVMQGQGTVADQWVAPGFFGHSDKVERTAYDPEAAKALLAEAGYPDGFKLTIHAPSGRYVKDSDVMQAVGQMFSRIGIETEVIVQPWTTYSDQLSSQAFSVFMASWGINTGEVSNPSIALVATPNAEKGTGRNNASGISVAEIDDLLERASTELDVDERRVLLEQVSEEVFGEDLLILPLHYENVVLGAKENISYAPRSDKYTLAYEIGHSS